MSNKKVIAFTLSVFIAAFGTYKAIKDLSDAFKDFDFDEEESDEL